MFETQKIDTFFSGEKNLLDEEEKIFVSRRTKVVRFFKLFLPCLTALLLGLGVLLFDFEANSDSTVALAEEEKIYFEKFRMKNTVFEITERDNQYSTLKSDLVEEIESNSKIYTLTMPWAKTLDKGKVITLTAQKGTYDQNTQQLNVESDVVANYDKKMEIKTQSATYNFGNETGYGNEKIVGNGEAGYFEADKFTFDKHKKEIVLINNVYMKNDTTELKTPSKVTLYASENKSIALNSTIKYNNNILKGDTVTIFFKDTKTFDINRIMSIGHTEIYYNGIKVFANKGEYDDVERMLKLFEKVKIIDKSGYVATADFGFYDLNKKTFTLEKGVRITKNDSVITAQKAVYFQDKDEFRFYNDVKVTQTDSVASAESGVYFIKKNLAELENNVIITKNGNEVHGDKAISDFTTSKSRLIAKNGGRIHGKILENTFKKDTKD